MVPGHTQTGVSLDKSIYIADSTGIFYQVGYRYVDSVYRDNGTELSHFLQSIRKALDEERPVRITIYSTASPDGDWQANKLLSHRRADEMANYLMRQIPLTPEVIEKRAGGVDWEKLRRLVETSDMPYKEEVLQILNRQELPGKVDEKEKTKRYKQALLLLHGGEPYRYLKQYLFPDLRNSVNALYVWGEKPSMPPTASIQTIQTEQAPLPEVEATALPPAIDVPSDVAPAEADASDRHHRLYVKTNALGWAMLVMNAAVEWEFSERFSLHVPVFYSAANYFSRQRKFRILGTLPELRIYPLPAGRFFAGIHFGVASYNLALAGEDWRIQDHGGHTPALGGGLSVGYRMPFCRNRRFRLEFSVGAGAYRAHYDKFYNEPNGAYAGTVRDTYIGIDHVGVSFSYMFDLKRRKR